MKRILFYTVYWLVAILVLSLILLSAKYSFGQALLTSCSILPGVLMAKYLGRDISFADKKKGIWATMCLSLSVLVVTYFNIFCVHWSLLKLCTASPILLNPMFLLLIAGSYTAINLYLERLILGGKVDDRDQYISFISDRKTVKLELAQIKYVESNNDEVWIRTVSGMSYRTKMKISRWEEFLDDRFVRIHRSYIVNKDLITSYSGGSVFLGDEQIEVSRKYRDGLNLF